MKYRVMKILFLTSVKVDLFVEGKLDLLFDVILTVHHR